jgi:CHAT domain-containing protein/tetratricopeptide (TPR) repeat protein
MMGLFETILLAALSGLGSEAAPAAAVPLSPGERVSGVLAAGEIHTYSIDLRAGEFARLAVVQQDRDVAAALVAPNGLRTEVNVAAGSYGLEPVSVLAESAGGYHVEVRATATAASTRYAIESEAPRAATALDRVHIRAERAQAEGAALARSGAPGASRAAVERFSAALAAWTQLGDTAWQTEALLSRATVRAEELGEFPEVVEDTTAALRLARQLGDRRAEARALSLMAGARLAQDDHEPAMESLEQALALQRSLGDRAGEAGTLRTMGWAHSYTGEPRKHVALARHVLELSRELGDPVLEAWAHMDLGGAHANASDFQASVDSFRQALAMWRASGDRAREAITLQNLGAQYGSLGDDARALAAYEEALANIVAGGHRESEAVTYLSMGMAHARLERPEKALELYGRALPIYREIGVRRREAQTLGMMGAVLSAMRRYDEARRHLEEALRVASDLNDSLTDATVSLTLGTIDLESGRHEAAAVHFRRAAERARAGGRPQGEAKALFMLGRLARDAGRLSEAQAQAEAALGLLEKVRRSLTSPVLRSAVAASARETYELYLDVLMGLHGEQPGAGFDARALEVSEQARARGLVDLLIETGLQIRAGVDPALLAEERAIQDRLTVALDRQLRTSPQAREDVQRASRAVQALTTELDQVRDAIRIRHPRFAALREPPRLDTAAIQREVLDGETVLLEYALGERRSFLWVVARDGMDSRELPARAVIERAVREAHGQLSEPPSATSRQPTPTDAVARLADIVLGPAREALTAKRLLIVADGALHYVPFAALPHPTSRQPLVTTHEIVAAPSAAVVALLRFERSRRGVARRTLAVFADPVFDLDDERLPASAASGGERKARASGGEALERALRSTGLEGGLARLPFSRREAEGIASLLPARELRMAVGFEANRTAVAEPSLADYRMVHFATHGFLNGAQPEHSGIVLSLLDRDGRDVPGFLTITDVFSLHLNADLVVLSGCRTALGREISGEGLVGLSRGLMYAGTARVVSSLWRVDDAATADLMKRFYRAVLEKGLPPAAALRFAQLEMMRRARFRHPFFWAAFQLQGEWR